ncbi:hypothetical protein NBRC116583_27040 [Arenicella sp. 4NH20-0111]|uniref:LytR/AlgR family response regulator transcription factor n=1 Tax=Arenicella sp. 4NH20-0111 TaxID=3127648 RepID=UPI003109B25E
MIITSQEFNQRTKLPEFRFAAFCWLGYLSYAFFYCLLYQHWVLGNSYALIESLIWVAKEWGSWLIITPLVVGWMMSNGHLKSSILINLYLVAALTAAGTIGRTGLEIFWENATLLTSAVKFVTPNLAASVITLLVWHLISKPVKQEHESTLDYTRRSTKKSILVFKGSTKFIVDVVTIDYLKSAGNYVEVHAGGEEYIVRSSIVSLLSRLPTGVFIQVHRSYAINIHSLERVTPNNSGNATLTLTNGVDVPLSRGKRKQFDAHFVN